MRKIGLLLIGLILLGSCAEVENGYKGVVYRPYGGGLDPEKTYDEGVTTGIGFLWNDMIVYNVRQQTTNIEADLLDVNGLNVHLTASVFHRIPEKKIGYLHLDRGENYEEDYIKPVFEGILKDVVGKYEVQDLISKSRQSAQEEIKQLLTEAFSENNLICDDVIIRDLDLPASIRQAIEAKQVQDQKNLLAEKKKVEEENLAAARVARAQGNYDAAQLDAKTKDLLSQPKLLKLKQLEIDQIWAEKGVSPYGNNNVFGGGSGVSILKGSLTGNK